VCSRLLRLIALLLFGFAPYAIAADQAEIQKNGTDLRKNSTDLRTAKFFSRPITELEVILLNLKAQAEKSASFVTVRNLMKIAGHQLEPEGDAGFDPTSGRIVLLLKLTVDDMSDPWQVTCDDTLRGFYGLFYFPPKDIDENARLAVMGKYFGEAIRIDLANAKGAVDILLNSIVTRVIFSVADKTNPRELKWSRTCTKDNVAGNTSYTEHRYH